MAKKAKFESFADAVSHCKRIASSKFKGQDTVTVPLQLVTLSAVLASFVEAAEMAGIKSVDSLGNFTVDLSALPKGERGRPAGSGMHSRLYAAIRASDWATVSAVMVEIDAKIAEREAEDKAGENVEVPATE